MLKEEEEKLGEGIYDFADEHQEEEIRGGDRERYGGRGRGNRGGRGGFRGGRGGRGQRHDNEGGERKHRPRDEFEGEEDEDEHYEQPKKTANRRTNKKEDLKVDEGNYPTL